MGVRIEGLRETIRSLERFGVEVKDLKAAFNRIGNIIVGEARTLVASRTGRLAASIKASNTKNKSIVRAGGGRILYAGVIHYGGYNHITANPFLTDAVSRKQSKAVSEMERELDFLIKRLDLN
jgi:hypothetical protein